MDRKAQPKLFNKKIIAAEWKLSGHDRQIIFPLMDQKTKWKIFVENALYFILFLSSTSNCYKEIQIVKQYHYYHIPELTKH